MKPAQGKARLAGGVVLVVALSSPVWGQNRGYAGTEPGSGKREVVISIPDRKLAVLDEGVVLRVFPVAVGGQDSPSPAGEFRIVRRLVNPTYYHPGIVIPPGKDNPLGPRWIGLNKKGFGIHGTNAPKSVGKAASHGCIRLRNQDVVALYAMVRVGDLVRIQAERDTGTAQVFGAGSSPGSVLAQASVGAAGGGH